MIKSLFAPAGANSARLFADPEKPSLFGATAFALRKIDIDLLSWYNFQE